MPRGVTPRALGVQSVPSRVRHLQPLLPGSFAHEHDPRVLNLEGPVAAPPARPSADRSRLLGQTPVGLIALCSLTECLPCRSLRSWTW